MKEKKSYFLSEYLGCFSKKINYEEYEDLLNKIKKINSSKKSTKVYGNIKYENGYAYIHVYNKITDKLTIKELDDYTSKYSYDELVNINSNLLKTKDGFLPDLNIAFFRSDKTSDLDLRVLYLPIKYKDDLKYFDKEYIKNFIKERANEINLNFFCYFADELRFYVPVQELVEEMFILCNNVYYSKDKDVLSSYLYKLGIKLINKYIVNYNKNGILETDNNGKYVISNRRYRDIGFLIRNYNMRESKKIYPTKYNMPIKKSNNYIDKSYILERIEREKDFLLEEDMLNNYDNLILRKE